MLLGRRDDGTTGAAGDDADGDDEEGEHEGGDDL
jgi:hypothetical protein